ncbi:ABC-2 transporter permease [Bacillus sp. BAU-SS-2023]|nr:ABC-2 transporter permease [Bacillus sp. BAU-SS-2023]
MGNIVKLTKMSLNNLTAGVKSLGFLLAVWAVVSIVSPSFLSILFGMAGYLLINQIMAYEDMNGIDNLITTIPVKRSEYVMSRYVLGILIALVVIIVLTLIYFITNILNKVEIPLEMLMLISLISSVFSISLIIPVSLKFGAKNGKMIMFLLLMIIMYIPMGIMQFVSSDDKFVIEVISAIDKIGLPIILVLSSTIFLAVSMIVSLKIYNAKEIK